MMRSYPSVPGSLFLAPIHCVFPRSSTHKTTFQRPFQKIKAHLEKYRCFTPLGGKNKRDALKLAFYAVDLASQCSVFLPNNPIENECWDGPAPSICCREKHWTGWLNLPRKTLVLMHRVYFFHLKAWNICTFPNVPLFFGKGVGNWFYSLKIVEIHRESEPGTNFRGCRGRTSSS